MSDAVVVALIALLGTSLGSFAGILQSSKVTVHRLQQLEIKVDKHNHLVERMIKVEAYCENLDEKVEKLERKEV